MQELVAKLLGDRHCHGNHFVPHSLGGRPYVSPRVWSWSDHPILS